jgi:formylglycine-generating enzyme required for sulfatase activity
MFFVKASNFKMGSKGTEDYTDGFYIDKYPVTNAEYKEFLKAKKRRVPRTWDNKTKTYPPGKDNHPVRGVSFFDAKAYAESVGKRLPTEKEWEKAARGAKGRQYPWGNAFASSRCNTLEAKYKDTTEVIQFDPAGASPYGVIDMAGNVWEWVDTWAREDEKKVKGGCYKYDQYAAICSNSESYDITSGRPYDVGFRCVKDVL